MGPPPRRPKPKFPPDTTVVPAYMAEFGVSRAVAGRAFLDPGGYTHACEDAAAWDDLGMQAAVFAASIARGGFFEAHNARMALVLVEIFLEDNGFMAPTGVEMADQITALAEHGDIHKFAAYLRSNWQSRGPGFFDRLRYRLRRRGTRVNP